MEKCSITATVYTFNFKYIGLKNDSNNLSFFVDKQNSI